MPPTCFAVSQAMRDLALAESITLGCLRHQSQLDYLIEFFSGRAGSVRCLPRDAGHRAIFDGGILQNQQGAISVKLNRAEPLNFEVAEVPSHDFR